MAYWNINKSFIFLVQWVSEIQIFKVIQLKWGGNQLIIVQCMIKLAKLRCTDILQYQHFFVLGIGVTQSSKLFQACHLNHYWQCCIGWCTALTDLLADKDTEAALERYNNGLFYSLQTRDLLFCCFLQSLFFQHQYYYQW